MEGKGEGIGMLSVAEEMAIVSNTNKIFKS